MYMHTLWSDQEVWLDRRWGPEEACLDDSLISKEASQCVHRGSSDKPLHTHNLNSGSIERRGTRRTCNVNTQISSYGVNLGNPQWHYQDELVSKREGRPHPTLQVAELLCTIFQHSSLDSLNTILGVVIVNIITVTRIITKFRLDYLVCPFQLFLPTFISTFQREHIPAILCIRFEFFAMHSSIFMSSVSPTVFRSLMSKFSRRSSS